VASSAPGRTFRPQNPATRRFPARTPLIPLPGTAAGKTTSEPADFGPDPSVPVRPVPPTPSSERTTSMSSRRSRDGRLTLDSSSWEPTGMRRRQHREVSHLSLQIWVERESGPRRSSGDQGKRSTPPAARGCVCPIVSWPNAGRKRDSSRALEVTEVLILGSHAANEARVNRELGAVAAARPP